MHMIEIHSEKTEAIHDPTKAHNPQPLPNKKKSMKRRKYTYMINIKVLGGIIFPFLNGCFLYLFFGFFLSYFNH